MSDTDNIKEKLLEEYVGLEDEIEEWQEKWDVDDIDEMSELVEDAQRDREMWRNAESTRRMIRDVIDV